MKQINMKQCHAEMIQKMDLSEREILLIILGVEIGEAHAGNAIEEDTASFLFPDNLELVIETKDSYINQLNKYLEENS